jgi:hypothetical protein
VEGSEILRQLVALAEEAGVSVRHVRTGEGETPARSGLCRVKGRPVLVLSTADPLEARIDAVAAALRLHGASLLEARFLPPALRERIDRPLPGGSR